MQAAGFVLVGGLSRRMGCNKALLGVNLGTLVEDVAFKVRDVAGSVALVGRPEEYRTLGIDCLADLRPGLGPLAGIETALNSRRGEINLILACDMPGVNVSSLSAMLREAEKTRTPCLVAKDASGLIHPLCAVYRSSCLAPISNALTRGRLKLLDVIEELRASTFEIGTNLWNINTPSDWAAWQEHGFA